MKWDSCRVSDGSHAWLDEGDAHSKYVLYQTG